MCQEEKTATFDATVADRRTVLKVAGASGATLMFSTAKGMPAARAAVRKRAYVLVVDGCRPGEIDDMPNLKALREGGTWYPAARSLPVMETIPNHVMMMTGVRPARNGVPANSIYDRTKKAVRDCSLPTDIAVTTIIDQLNKSGRTTGTVLSKEYLYSVFGERATHRWEPKPVIPVSGHAPDEFTMEALLAMVDEFDPDFVFCNLGDVDRIGHSDLTGTTLKAARRAALVSTDTQVGRFVSKLKSTGKWDTSMVLVLADHSMDWSIPSQTISLKTVFDKDAALSGNYEIAQNGGAELVYWTGAASAKDAALTSMRTKALATPGVFAAHVIAKTPTCTWARRPVTCSSTARPAGGSATPARRATRSRATTGTRPPSRSRSSSPVARRACARASPARPARTRWTWRRRWRATSVSPRPPAGGKAPPASEPVQRPPRGSSVVTHGRTRPGQAALLTRQPRRDDPERARRGGDRHRPPGPGGAVPGRPAACRRTARRPSTRSTGWAVGPGMRLLDVGSGIGGTSRMAAMSGAEVTGIDLSPEFVDTATELTERVGLGDRVTFLATPGESLPLEDGAFDAAVMIHVGMNIPDKQAVFTEVHRVLRARQPVRRLRADAHRVPESLPYPLPWAEDERSSFVESVDDYTRHLEAAGFTIDEVEDRTASTLGPPPAGPVSNAVVFGQGFMERIGNNIAATKAGLLGAVLVVARA